jgi:hypothetical protein
MPTREEILCELAYDKKITLSRVKALRACLDFLDSHTRSPTN